ncbi:hypothetical protein [Paenibacillus haidiansis]|uniref:hypothetical protein n=1 Tax=Paenibacillus haidiansis TaxID=1574488 RepID=UPI002F94FB85
MNISAQTGKIIKILLCLGVLSTGSAQLQTAYTFAATEDAPALAATGKEGPAAPKELRNFAARAIEQLSQAEPFTGWAHADTVIEPLGPGTHSWLVTVRPRASAPADNPAAGYLIISATPSAGEYKLVEYGLGPHSVFAAPALESGLAGLGLPSRGASGHTVTPVYGGPVLAEWMITLAGKPGTVHFLDAVTGELLPETTGSWNRQAARYVPPTEAAGSGQSALKAGETVRLAEPFDPYGNILWMAGDAFDLSQSNFEQLLKANRRLVFAATGADRTYNIPLPIYGYQKWNDETGSGISAIYALTGTKNSGRWIALGALEDSGDFVVYPETP